MAPATLGEAAAQWASTTRVPVGIHRIRYREAGSGLPLVLVHGLGVSADYWTRNGPPLAAAGFRVLAPDLPGFGRTRGPYEGLGVSGQATAVRAWAEAIGLRSAVFLGHSLSCQTVIELAVRHPEMVLGLVLAAPTGEGSSGRRLFRQAIGLLRDIRRESLLLASLILQAYVRAGPKRILRTWRMGASHDPVALLPSVRVPGLVIVGENDPVVDPEFARAIANGLVDGRVVTVAGGSHGVIFDETGQFNRAVIEFLKRVDRRVGGPEPLEGSTGRG